MKQLSAVDALKRVHLALEAGSAPAAMDLSGPPLELVFIIGIGSAGLTPFDCLLNGRVPGEEIAFQVGRAEAGRFFGQLADRLGPLPAEDRPLFFKARLIAVETPAPREIIRAMAESTAHGHGCDCGCGSGIPHQ